MITLQISSAQGPDECALAVALATECLLREAERLSIFASLVEAEEGPRDGTYFSALIILNGEDEEKLSALWCGTVRWNCTSPYRPNHGRKNWFIGVSRLSMPNAVPESAIRFEAIRASGPGGQHVNKTDSAIRATHIATGISVKVQSERSQHANKRLARQLIAHRLQERQEGIEADHRAQRRSLHYQVERGNPIRTFKGINFEPV